MSANLVIPGSKYTLEDNCVGEGCQGKVYLGRDSETDEKVAIKLSLKLRKCSLKLLLRVIYL